MGSTFRLILVENATESGSWAQFLGKHPKKK